jgi:hypothetical protein
MSEARFTKRYATESACVAARIHYDWLSVNARPLRLPRLLAVEDRRMDFEHVHGRSAIPADLEVLAEHLGDAHGAAWIATLRTARLDIPHPAVDHYAIADFVSPRLIALNRRGAVGSSSETHKIQDLLRSAADGPVAFYKDANPRNFLVNHTGRVATIDFDDLTLAPFGYDLAKLIVTLSMTYGRLPSGAIARALDAYNTAAARHAVHLGRTSPDQLLDYAEVHHVLTSRYLGRGGYRHPWPTVRPEPAKDGAL